MRRRSESPPSTREPKKTNYEKVVERLVTRGKKKQQEREAEHRPRTKTDQQIEEEAIREADTLAGMPVEADLIEEKRWQLRRGAEHKERKPVRWFQATAPFENNAVYVDALRDEVPNPNVSPPQQVTPAQIVREFFNEEV